MLIDRRQILIGGGAAVALGAGGTGLALNGMGAMADYDAAAAAARAALMSDPSLHALVRFATLAANGHNSQPWRFRIGTERIDLLPDFTRRTSVVDPDDHHLFVSLGCATENLRLAAAAAGRRSEIAPRSGTEYAIGFSFHPMRPTQDVLFAAIPHRQSTRGAFDGQPCTTAELRLLMAAAALPGVDVTLLTERRAINRVRDLVIAGNTAQLNDPAFRGELKRWLRYNPREAIRHGDGLFSGASGNPSLPSWAGPIAFDRLMTAQDENKRLDNQLATSAGLAIFAGAGADRDHWIEVGRACQRFALQATALGLKCAFVNQPVEVVPLRPALASLLGMAGRRPDIVMRFGRGAARPFSLRRPVSAVLDPQMA